MATTPHQGLDNQIPVKAKKNRRHELSQDALPELGEIKCRKRLGGLLKSYYRVT